MSDLRALTLHQPWASLIAVGAKTILTKSWPCPPALIGEPLLIHAAAKPPKGWWSTIWRDDEYERAPEVVRAAAAMVDFQTDGPFWTAEESTNGEDWYHRWRGPLGAVVASCRVAACVPITDDPDDYPDPISLVEAVPDGRLGLWLAGDDEVPSRDISDQLPFGDFSPGRYAWLLEDVASTEQRCPRCWGTGYLDIACTTCGGMRFTERHQPMDNGPSFIDYRSCAACECPTCCVQDERGISHPGHCPPVPMKGKQRLWTVRDEDWPT